MMVTSWRSMCRHAVDCAEGPASATLENGALNGTAEVGGMARPEVLGDERHLPCRRCAPSREQVDR